MQTYAADASSEQSFSGWLYHGTNEKFDGAPIGPNGWVWWSDDRSWAQKFGARVIEKDFASLRLVKLPADPAEAVDALEAAGIDTSGHDWDVQESYRALSDSEFGPLMAARVDGAGYDGFSHPDNRYSEGKGTAVALTNAALVGPFKVYSEGAMSKAKPARVQRQDDLEPDDDESYEDFMDRCGDELGDDDACQMIWDNRAADGIRFKTHAAKVNGLDFVLSDETPDRMDDVIMSDGWDLANFKRNPIALFGHRSDFPIGKWKNLRVADKQLRGDLELAPQGTSSRIDEIRALVDAGILKAVSVGFRPIESQPRKESQTGVFWTKAELVETSLVAVPANPNALAVAKQLNISSATQDLVFAGKGTRDRIARRGLPGGQASSSSHKGYRRSEPGKGTTMSFAQRIVAGEQRVNALRDQLKAHYEKVDDTNVSDEQLQISSDLNDRIKQEERGLNGLRDAEKNLGETSDGGSRAVVTRAPSGNGQQLKPYAEPVRPFDRRSRKRNWTRSICWSARAWCRCLRIGSTSRLMSCCGRFTATTRPRGRCSTGRSGLPAHRR